MSDKASTFRILIVDDTPTIHDDFRKILTPAVSTAPQVDTLAAAIFGQASPTPAPVRFEVDSATQGETGLALLQDALEEGEPYALAFVDMRMPPGWDGLETIRHLWAADPRLQVVICTAYSDHSWSGITERLGHSDNLLVLKKPFDNVEVQQLSHALVRKWKLARELEAHVHTLDDALRTRTEELRGAEEGFIAAFDASPLAQAIISIEDPHVIAVNTAFEKTLGISKSEVVGLTPETFDRGFDPARYRELLRKLAEGKPIDDHAFVHQPAPGVKRDLRCSARPLKIRGRDCAIWVLRDITDQLETERQLRQSQKMDAIGQLAAGVAHDFNNLLTVIQGYTAELLAGGCEPSLQRMLEPVQAAATRASNLTRQLLVFSRKEVLHPQSLDLVVVFSELQPLLRRLIGAHIDFHWSLPPQLAPVMADPANVEQVIVNLVINARDAMPEGGRIEVSARECYLDAAAPELPRDAKPGHYIEVAVADNGSGIKPEVLPRIFEPFFTTKEAGKGTGLGLSTVYSIVHQQGGWINVQSQLGAGTTFVFYQPVATNGAKVRSASPLPIGVRPRFDCGYQNILVVEDDLTVQGLLATIMKSRGLQFTVASDGVSAQQIWHDSPVPFDLLITDIVMPNGVNGIRLARIFREANPYLGVIITSGYSELLSDPNNLSMPGPPPKILFKPFSPSGLLAAMAESAAATRV